MSSILESYQNTDGGASFGSLLKRAHIDPPLMAGLLLIMAFGLFVLYSAGGQDQALMIRQGIRLGVGFACMLIIAQFSPDFMRRWSIPIFFAGLILLVLVLYVGVKGGGAQRWLNLGIMRFQPSELMKIALPLALAAYLHNRRAPPRLSHLIICSIFIAVSVALILKQPDLGTSILIGASGLFVLFMAGIRWRYIVGGLASIFAAAPVAWQYLHEYQQKRVLTFLNPEEDPLGAGYHIIQSKIAIGSGGLFGKGWLNGTQSQLDFLPERSTDFIFAVIGEELGLIGIIPLLCLYLFIVFRGLYIAATAQNAFQRLICGSLSLTFFFYVFVNTGMVTGLLPVVGVPLPLISYGGTSVVTLMIGFGILMSVQTHKKFLDL